MTPSVLPQIKINHVVMLKIIFPFRVKLSLVKLESPIYILSVRARLETIAFRTIYLNKSNYLAFQKFFFSS